MCPGDIDHEWLIVTNHAWSTTTSHAWYITTSHAWSMKARRAGKESPPHIKCAASQ